MDDHEYLIDCCDDLTEAIKLLRKYQTTHGERYFRRAVDILVTRRAVVILLIQT